MAAGTHTLRVRAIGHGGVLSPLVSVKIVVTVPYPRLKVGRAIAVGAGAGVPAVGGGSAWIATDHGVLRLNETTGKPTGAALLPPAGSSGFVSIAFADGAAWFANYDRGTLTRVS